MGEWYYLLIEKFQAETVLIELIEVFLSLESQEHSLQPFGNWSSWLPCKRSPTISNTRLILGSISHNIVLDDFKCRELQNYSVCGALLDDLGDMVNLQTLNPSMNSFNGSIPASWSQLSNLKQL